MSNTSGFCCPIPVYFLCWLCSPPSVFGQHSRGKQLDPSYSDLHLLSTVSYVSPRNVKRSISHILNKESHQIKYPWRKITRKVKVKHYGFSSKFWPHILFVILNTGFASITMSIQTYTNPQKKMFSFW